MNRAVVKQEYKVALRTPDGKEFTWPVSDCYFERKMARISDRILDVIRHQDLENQFNLTDPSVKFQVTLVHIETMETKDWTGPASDRYDAVGQAFRDLTGKTQGENLDEWKVLQAGAAS